MTTFTVWKFEDAGGAQRAEETLKQAQDDGLVELVDHAVLSWEPDAEKPELHHKHDSMRRSAGWGAMWGVMGGALFAIPVAGAAIGLGLGALRKVSEGTGISEAELERVRDQITPGTSALFLVTDNANLDRLGERFTGHDSRLLTTNLTEAERDTLLETFGGG